MEFEDFRFPCHRALLGVGLVSLDMEINIIKGPGYATESKEIDLKVGKNRELIK